MKLFHARIMWYDDFSDESKVDNCFVFAEDLTDATGMIVATFALTDIESLNIKEVCSEVPHPILFVPNDEYLIKQISKSNTF